MKILVFSDSHGKTEDMILTTDALHPDAVFHLGDLWTDSEELTYAFPDLPLYRIVGNCDWGSSGLPVEQRVVLDGITFLLIHGHLYGIKSGYASALNYARSCGADVLLCGHTHVPVCKECAGVQLVNPGSVRYTHTYALIEVRDGAVMCTIQKLTGRDLYAADR